MVRLHRPGSCFGFRGPTSEQLLATRTLDPFDLTDEQDSEDDESDFEEPVNQLALR